MYQVESSATILRGDRRLRRLRVGRNVLLLGLVSLFTDISAEMVATILPLYLVYSLGLSPLQFGVVDGLYQGTAALVRVASGVTADRWGRHKDVAGFGYALSAVCKLLFLVVGSAFSAVAWIVFLDRTGKGVRTAPRDALISLSTPRENLATAFGVHRALDTVGAMIGPLVAFALLALAPREYDTIFVVSFAFALIGLGILFFFVENRRDPVETIEAAPPDTPGELEPGAPGAPAELEPARGEFSLRAAARLLAAPRFAMLMAVGGALGLVTVSDGFVYLVLQRRLDFDPSYLPLLYVGTALAYMVLAMPVGILADRIGRGRVFIAGYVLLLLVYASLVTPAFGLVHVALVLLLFGAYYAATEGVLMALASAIVPAELRASGLGFLVTATSLARLGASVAFGTLWTWYDVDTAVYAFAAGLAVSTVLAAVVLAIAGRAGRAAAGSPA